MIVSPLRVYLSVSWKGDVNKERRGAEAVIRSDLLMEAVYPHQASVRDVTSDYFKLINECQILVAILGSEYSEHVSNEVNYAFAKKIPVLCFVKYCRKDDRVKEEIRKLQNQRIVTKEFRTVASLRRSIKEAVINLISQKYKDCLAIETSILELVNDGRIEILRPPPFEREYRDVRRINPYEQR